MARERADLIAEMRKQECALDRLDELFLFADSPMTQKDYLLKKQQISDKIASCQQQLHRLEQKSLFTSTLLRYQMNSSRSAPRLCSCKKRFVSGASMFSSSPLT